jgi:hypothetical protein
MPKRLSLRATVVLVALAFGLALAVQALLSGGSSAAAPVAQRSADGLLAEAPAAAAPDLTVPAAAAVPALREPRARRKPKPKPKRRRVREAATPAPVVTAAPVVTPTPTPTPTPPTATPVPRAVQPAPRSTPTPAPTSPPPEGDFDTTGDG